MVDPHVSNNTRLTSVRGPRLSGKEGEFEEHGSIEHDEEEQDIFFEFSIF